MERKPSDHLISNRIALDDEIGWDEHVLASWQTSDFPPISSCHGSLEGGVASWMKTGMMPTSHRAVIWTRAVVSMESWVAARLPLLSFWEAGYRGCGAMI